VSDIGAQCTAGSGKDVFAIVSLVDIVVEGCSPLFACRLPTVSDQATYADIREN